MTAPTGRSGYKPGRARVGEPTPQSDPELFSTEDLLAEAKYLLRLNNRHGSNALRTSAYLRLMFLANERTALARLNEPAR